MTRKNLLIIVYVCATTTINLISFYVEMSSQNTAMVNTDDIERRRERWRYYACLRRQREDNESRKIRLARRCANYSRQRQQTLGGDHN